MYQNPSNISSDLNFEVMQANRIDALCITSVVYLVTIGLSGIILNAYALSKALKVNTLRKCISK
jgi:hypothetical protein